MLRERQLTSDPRVGGSELGLEGCPIRLRRLQFGRKELRPDSLLGVILPSFVLLAKELANVLLGALRNTRERGPLRTGGVRRRGGVIAVQRLEIKTRQEYGNQKMK